MINAIKINEQFKYHIIITYTYTKQRNSHLINQYYFIFVIDNFLNKRVFSTYTCSIF